MDDNKYNGLEIISAAAENLPAPVSTGMLKALSNLLGGLTAIPAAWLKRPAQAIEDTTTARSTVASTLAKAVAESALTDPVLMQAAAEIYLPTAIRKAENRVRTAKSAIDHASETLADGEGASAPGDDWMNSYVRFAEDASSEKLQDMFGRILAGEIVRPGSFSIATLRTVAELDQTIANDFSLVWAKSVGDAVNHDDEFQRGEWYLRWMRLAEAGLMSSQQSAQYTPPYADVINGNAVWVPMSAGGFRLVIHFTKDCKTSWKNLKFTKIGCQLGGIIATPNYESNIRKAATNLVSEGIFRIDLYSNNKLVDNIYNSQTV